MNPVSIRCSHCQQEKKLGFEYLVLSYVCEKCESVHVKSNQALPFKKENITWRKKKEPELALFSRLVFDFGDKLSCQVMGVAVKSEVGRPSNFWYEYVLLSDTHNIYYLTSYDSIWTFLTPVEAEINASKKYPSIFFRNRTYVCDQDFLMDVLYAKGYFPYNLASHAKKQIRLTEYLQGIQLFSVELNTVDNKFQAFAGDFISRTKLTQSIVDKAKLPSIKAKAHDHRETEFSNCYLTFFFGFLASIVICFLLQSTFNSYKKNEIVLNETIQLIPDSARKNIIYTFKIKGTEKSNLHINASQPIDNSWAYLSITLFNETTEEERNLEFELEHYSGVQGGESWSEGSFDDCKNLNGIEPGNYRLIVYPDANFTGYYNSYASTPTDAHPISIALTSDPTSYHNFWYTLLIWVIGFVLYWLFVQGYENDIIYFKTVYRVQDFIWSQYRLLWFLVGCSVFLLLYNHAIGAEVFNNAAVADGMDIDKNAIHHK